MNALLLSCNVLLLSIAFLHSEKFGFLSLFSFIPLLFYINKKYDKDTNLYAKLNTGLIVFIYSLIISVISFYSFFDIFPLDWAWGDLLKNITLTKTSFILGWIIFITIITIPYGIFGIILTFLRKINNTIYYPFIVASTWVLLENLKAIIISLAVYGDGSLPGTHYTYFSLAYTIPSLKYINTLFAVGGIYMVSFFIVFINTVLYLIINRKSNKWVILLLLICIFSVTYFPYIYIKKLRSTSSDDNIFKITLTNTNFKSTENKDADTEKIKTISDYLFSEKSILSKVIIVPENIDLIGVQSFKKNDSLIIGSLTRGNIHRVYYYKQNDGRVNFFKKRLLMPIVEYDIFLTKIVNSIYIKNSNDLSTSFKDIKDGSNVELLSDDIKIYTSVCSENISPILYRNETINGSGLMVNLISHAIFHGSPILYRQTMEINKARAIENGRYFVVASNYSSSYIIRDDGTVMSITKTNGQVFAENKNVPIKYYITPYVKYGDYFIIISSFIMFIFITIKIIFKYVLKKY